MIRSTAAAVLLAGFTSALGLGEDVGNNNGVDSRINGHETATDNANAKGQNNSNENSVFHDAGETTKSKDDSKNAKKEGGIEVSGRRNGVRPN